MEYPFWGKSLYGYDRITKDILTSTAKPSYQFRISPGNWSGEPGLKNSQHAPLLFQYFQQFKEK